MPTYKFNPDKTINTNNFAAPFEVYDATNNKSEYKKILYGQTFATNRYYSKIAMENDHLEFISDEPYISPIICSYNGNENIKLNIPDYGNLVDIIISLEKNNSIELFFNNNKEKSIMIYHSGTIFKNIMLNNIRVINVNNNIKNKKYSISIISTNMIGGNIS